MFIHLIPTTRSGKDAVEQAREALEKAVLFHASQRQGMLTLAAVRDVFNFVRTNYHPALVLGFKSELTSYCIGLDYKAHEEGQKLPISIAKGVPAYLNKLTKDFFVRALQLHARQTRRRFFLVKGERPRPPREPPRGLRRL